MTVARVGRYEVVRELGRGGMGLVLVVRDPDLDRLLALKLIRGHAGAEEHERFGREAQVMARVRHRAVVRVHDLGQAAEGPYIVSDLVEGEALSQRLKAGPLEAREAARLVRELADGAAACHAQGVIHRDLKPANVIVQPDGAPVMLDFGVARDAQAERLTRTGQIVGTPSYMAPEQAQGSTRIDERADVYALGAILFECLAGRPPFHDAPSSLAVLRRVLMEDPLWPSATRADVPAPLEAIARVAMAKERLARHPSAAALRDDLDRWLTGERPWAADHVPAPRRRRPWALPATAAGVLAVAALSALALRRPAGPVDVAPVTSGVVDPAEREAGALRAEPDWRRREEGARAWLQAHRDHPLRREVDALRRGAAAQEQAWRELLAALRDEAPAPREAAHDAWLERHGDHPGAPEARRLLDEARARRPRAVFPTETSPQRVLAFALGGGRVLAVEELGQVTCWTVGDLAPAPRALGRFGRVDVACVSRDGRHLVLAHRLGDPTAEGPREVAVVALDDGRVTARFPCPVDRPLGVAATAELVAICGRQHAGGGVAALARLSDGGPLLRLDHPGADEVLLTSFTPDGRQVLTCTWSEFELNDRGTNENALRLWTLEGREVGTPVPLDTAAVSLAWSPDGTRLVVGTGSGTAYRLRSDPARGLTRDALADPRRSDFLGHEARSQQRVAAADHALGSAHSTDVLGIAFLSSATFISASHHELRAWRLDRQEDVPLERLTVLRRDALEAATRIARHEAPIASFSVSPEDGLMVLGTAAGQVEVWTLPAVPDR